MQSPVIEIARAAANRYRPALLLSAIYDGLLGLAFLFFSEQFFRALGVETTADPVYVQLAAGLIAIMGLGFYLAWRNPLVNWDLVLVGAVFKAFYILLAVWAWLRGEVPHAVFLLFAGVDVIFLIVLLLFLLDTRPARAVLAGYAAGEPTS